MDFIWRKIIRKKLLSEKNLTRLLVLLLEELSKSSYRTTKEDSINYLRCQVELAGQKIGKTKSRIPLGQGWTKEYSSVYYRWRFLRLIRGHWVTIRKPYGEVAAEFWEEDVITD
jgi:hypothetical protein